MSSRKPKQRGDPVLISRFEDWALFGKDISQSSPRECEFLPEAAFRHSVRCLFLQSIPPIRSDFAGLSTSSGKPFDIFHWLA